MGEFFGVAQAILVGVAGGAVGRVDASVVARVKSVLDFPQLGETIGIPILGEFADTDLGDGFDIRCS